MKRTKLPYPAPEFSVHITSGSCHDVIIKLGTCVQLMILEFTSSNKHSCNRELVLEGTKFLQHSIACRALARILRSNAAVLLIS
jgi:hypothetical protein